MITRLLGAGLVGVLLLGGGDVALASEVEIVTLETCKTVYTDSYMMLPKMPPIYRRLTKQVCKPTQSLVGKSNKLFDLRVSLSTTSGQPLADKQVQLKINHGCAPHHLAKYRDLALSPRIIAAICRLYPASDFGLNKDLLARWQGSLTGTTDSDGKVTFDNLFFRFEPPQGIELAVVTTEEDGTDEILQLFPIVTSMQIVSARYYGIIEPPKSQWHLHYNRDIPARAEVRWRVSSLEDPSAALVTGKFSTTETSRELLITTEGLVCDGSSDSNHLLQVMITPPSHSDDWNSPLDSRELSSPPLLQDISSVDSVLVSSQECRKI